MSVVQEFSAMPFPFTIVDAAELGHRPSRAPDFERENRMLGDLARTLAVSPRATLQKVADVALNLCDAQSAGVGVLEYDGDQPVLRWRALAGASRLSAGGAQSSAFDSNAAVLDRAAARFIAQHVHDGPPAQSSTEEALLIPFQLNHTQLGALGVVTRDATRRFDAEDVRLLKSLGAFATAACQGVASQERLESDLAQRAEASALLEAADHNRDRFIAILGHELRGQLVPAKNVAELLKSETLDIKTRRYISEIVNRQVSGMTRLVDDLLDSARLRSGNIELRRIPVALVDVIDRAVEDVGASVLARKQTLTVVLPSEPISVDADVMWLSQALQNLIGNASKYTERGGNIVVNARREGSQVAITVSDDGIGIAPTELEHVFDLYVQLGQDKARTSNEGLGVGLYLVRMLIEAHGGSVQAISAGRDCGSAFVVRLPCAGATSRLA